MPPLHRKLGDQDGILRQHTHHHDRAHLNINVVVYSKDLKEGKYPEYTCRYGQYNGKRKDIAFILRTQQEVDEYQAQDKDEDDLGASGVFFPGDPCISITPSFRQQLGSRFFNGLDRITRTVSGLWNPVDRCRIVKVIVAHCFRTVNLSQLDQLIHRHHLAQVILYIDAGKRFFIRPVGNVGLRHDAVVLAEPVEVTDIATAIIDLHGLHQLGNRHAHLLRLIVVHVYHILRIARRKGSKSISYFLALHQRPDKGIGHSAQPVHRSVGLILQRELKTGHITKTLYSWEGKEEGMRVFNVHGALHRQFVADAIDVF